MDNNAVKLKSKAKPVKLKVKRKRNIFDGFYYLGEVKNDSIVLEGGHLNKQLDLMARVRVEEDLKSTPNHFKCLVISSYLKDGVSYKEVVLASSQEAFTMDFDNLTMLVENTLDNLDNKETNDIKFIVFPCKTNIELSKYLNTNKEFLDISSDINI